MNREEAKALIASASRYTGEVCDLHPELGGERRTHDGQCPECHKKVDRDRVAAKRKSLPVLTRGVAPNRDEAIATGMSRYLGKVCEKHPEINGERATYNSVCVNCRRELIKRRNAIKRAAK